MSGIKDFIKMLNKLQDKNNRRLMLNFSSLFVLQGMNYILPLILFPYLVHILGIEYFGLLAFSTATIGIFRGFVSYGFELSGTKQIAIYKNNKNKVDKIYSSILIVKSLIASLSFLFLLLLIFTINKFNIHWEVLIYTYLIVIGDVLFPIWFFQGIEQMKLIAYLRIMHKIIFVIAIFFFIDGKEDYLLVPLTDSILSILVGVIAIIYISQVYQVKFLIPKYLSILFQIKNGWNIFMSRIAVIFYTSINTFLLGILTNNESVGIYAIAEKIYMAVRGIFEPGIQALFPFLSRKYTKNKKNYYITVKKIIYVYVVLLWLFSALIFTYSENIIELVSGKIIPHASILLNIFSVSLIFAIGSFFSTLLVIKAKSKLLKKTTLISMFINLLLVYPAIVYYNIYGLAVLFLIIQFLQSLLLMKYNFEIFKGKQDENN